jgi:hypothetical protein
MADNSRPFPPVSAVEIMELCGGNWLSLRSRYKPDQGESSWEESERAELHWQWLPAKTGDAEGQLGALQLQNPNTPPRQLVFFGDGRFQAEAGICGCWRLQPEAQLEIEHQVGARKMQETIWFQKPNLRLRSLLVWNAEILEASQFCSEIRRVSKPTS